MADKKVLTLHVKKIYFDAIDNGEKVREYREVNEYWKKRIVGRNYDEVVICMGYPKREDASRRIRFSYSGYEETYIVHPHFNDKHVLVFAIKIPQSNRISGGTLTPTNTL